MKGINRCGHAHLHHLVRVLMNHARKHGYDIPGLHIDTRVYREMVRRAVFHPERYMATYEWSDGRGSLGIFH